MLWLFALHLRAPGSTVILVANKCDGDSTDEFAIVADRVTRRVTELLQEWESRRGIQSTTQSRSATRSRGRGRMAASTPAAASAATGAGTTVTSTTRRRRVTEGTILLPEPSLVSCLDGSGLAELIDRVAEQGATCISVPPAWGLALRVIDALRGGHEPLQAAREHVRLSSAPPRFDDTLFVDRLA